MKTYCVKCRAKTENLNPRTFKRKNGKLIMRSNCTECETKKSRFVKEQEAKGLLGNLGIKTSLSKNFIVKSFVLSVWKWMKL